MEALFSRQAWGPLPRSVPCGARGTAFGTLTFAHTTPHSCSAGLPFSCKASGLQRISFPPFSVDLIMVDSRILQL